MKYYKVDITKLSVWILLVIFNTGQVGAIDKKPIRWQGDYDRPLQPPRTRWKSADGPGLLGQDCHCFGIGLFAVNDSE
jgi:hypothetical protein